MPTYVIKFFLLVKTKKDDPAEIEAIKKNLFDSRVRLAYITRVKSDKKFTYYQMGFYFNTDIEDQRHIFARQIFEKLRLSIYGSDYRIYAYALEEKQGEKRNDEKVGYAHGLVYCCNGFSAGLSA